MNNNGFAVNVRIMTPMRPGEAQTIAQQLARVLESLTGQRTVVHVQDQPKQLVESQ